MTWSKELFDGLSEECRKWLAKTPEGEMNVPEARVAPSSENLTLGSAKSVRAAALFFDLRGFTRRIDSDEMEVRLRGLAVLNAVIPVISRIVCGEGGYIEKNTGDGILAIIGFDQNDKQAIASSIVIALRIFAALEQIINPQLIKAGIEPTEARIGIDYGELLIARVGLPSGTASMDRNFITAVGSTANIACKIQQQAGTNEIWVGDSFRMHAPQEWLRFFNEVTIPDWSWIWAESREKYRIWNFTGRFTTNYNI